MMDTIREFDIACIFVYYFYNLKCPKKYEQIFSYNTILQKKNPSIYLNSNEVDKSDNCTSLEIKQISYVSSLTPQIY